jgi:hypothetical protein
MSEQVFINNFKTLILHALFGLLSYCLIVIAKPSSHLGVMVVNYVLPPTISLLLYFISGRFILTNTGSVKGNVLSVLLLALILLTLTIVDSYLFYMVHVPLVMLLTLLYYTFHQNTIIMFSAAVFLPSFFFYLGILSQRKEEKILSSTEKVV